MRLDIDLRYLPFAIIIWLTCLANFILSSNVLIYCCIGLILIYIIFGRFNLIFLSYLLITILTILISNYRFVEFNIEDFAIDQNKEVIVIGEIKSDLIPIDSPRFGTLEMYPSYYFKFRLDTLIQEQKSFQNISKVIKVNTSNIENLEFGTKIKFEGIIEKTNFGSIKYEITPELITHIGKPNLFNQSINQIRNNFISATQKINSQGAELLPGLILGDTRFQSKSLKENMKISGLTHLTAVSGGNIAILLIVLSFILRKLNINSRLQILILIVFLITFAFLVRTEPSVVRASFMSGIVLIAVLYGAFKQGLNALFLTICISLLLDPNLSISWGFSLSVFATFGLLVFTEPIQRYLSKSFPWLNPNLIVIFSVALTAQFSTIGLVAGLTGMISIWSVFANILVAAVVPIVTILGYLGLIFSNLSQSLSMIFNLPAAIFANWIVEIAQFFSQKEHNVIHLPAGILTFLIVNVVLVTSIIIIKKFKLINFLLITLITFLLINFVKIFIFDVNWPVSNWQFVMCDVGQGDGLVIRDSKGNTVVVDVGPSGNYMNNCLKDLGIKKIDFLLLTHYHLDHVDGLRDVIKNYQIDVVWTSWIREPHEESIRVDQLIQPLKVKHLLSGQKISLGEIQLTCLWPTTKKMDIESVANNSSLVVLVEIYNASILLTGDIEPPAQETIRNSWKELNADVIKIPHHGSKFQDAIFPKWSGARLALISVGADNTYGHPSKDAIELYEKAGMKVISSSESGSVSIYINKEDQIIYSTTG